MQTTNHGQINDWHKSNGINSEEQYDQIATVVFPNDGDDQPQSWRTHKQIALMNFLRTGNHLSAFRPKLEVALALRVIFAEMLQKSRSPVELTGYSEKSQSRLADELECSELFSAHSAELWYVFENCLRAGVQGYLLSPIGYSRMAGLKSDEKHSPMDMTRKLFIGE